MQSVEEYGYEEFSFPQGVACGNKYGIYVADTWNQRIQVMSTNGLVLRSFSGSKLNSPTGVAVDDEGFIIVADTWNHRLQASSTVREGSAWTGPAGSSSQTP